MAKIPARNVKLTFDQYPEIEIYAGSISVAEAIELDLDETSTEARFQKFAGALRSWNLEDDAGQPIPTTYEGVRSIDVAFALEVVRAWISALTAVSGPLDRPSTATLPWEGLGIPTEPLSTSPVS